MGSECGPGGHARAMPLVLFRLEGQRYALPLARVHRIVPAVEVAPLPGAPPVVLGAISVEGRHLPVLSLRRRLGLPDRELELSDLFVLAWLGGREVALVIDEVLEVVDRPPNAVSSPSSLAFGLERFLGLAELEQGLVLIHDLEAFLSAEESCALDRARTVNA